MCSETGKYLCHCLFFKKVVGLKRATLLKKTLAEVFSWEPDKFLERVFEVFEFFYEKKRSLRVLVILLVSLLWCIKNFSKNSRSEPA